MRLPLPKPVTKKRKPNASTVATDKDGWIDTNATKKKRKPAVSSSSKKKAHAKKSTKSKTKSKTKATKRARPASTSRPKKTVKRNENEVIELIEDSDNSEELEIVMNSTKPRPRTVSTAYASVIATGPTDQNNFSDDDSDSEYEFE